MRSKRKATNLTSFVDASVLVAIMAVEPDHAEWLRRLEAETALITSPLALWETARAVARRKGQAIAAAHADSLLVIGELAIGIVAIGEREAAAAADAHGRFGKGNHDARLNLGDCFAYACARTNNAKLIYKGNDFALTDLA